MEAMLFAIDPALLPNLPLGFDIPDTFSIEFKVLVLIKWGIGLNCSQYRQLDVESCQSDSSAGDRECDWSSVSNNWDSGSFSKSSQCPCCKPG